MSKHRRAYETMYRAVRNDIHAFCRYMRFEPTWQQKLVLDAVQAGYRRIAVKSGKGPGKTTCSTIIALWRAFRNLDALTVVTAPTMRQCRDVFLVELRRRLDHAHPILRDMIRPTLSRVVIAGRRDWGIKLVTANKPENAQGYHQPNMSWIAEEASGVPRPIIDQIIDTLTNIDSFFLQIGNPNTRDCAFFDCFHAKRHRWKCITLNAEQSPIVSQAHIEEVREEYGVDSDRYRVAVLGEFPFSDPQCIFDLSDLEACTKTDPYELALATDGYRSLPPRQFGIDFARFGSDESVIYRRSGNTIVEWQHFSHVEPARVVYRAFAMQQEAGWRSEDCLYVADADGMGQGVMHVFYEAHREIHEFHTSGTAYDSSEFGNKMTEAWFHVAKLARKRRLHIPDDNRLLQQLATRWFFVNKKGKLVVEPKEDYIKRGYDSPDRADALVMAFYDYAGIPGRAVEKPQSKRGPRDRIRA